jgi:two-component system, chemotaxis family, CheB/CheR fusion protein
MLKRKDFGGEKDFFVVAVGTSGNDSAALAEFFSKVLKDSGAAYVLLGQDDKTTALKRITTLPVTTLTRSVKIKANHVYIVPGDKDVTVLDGKLQASETQGKGERIDRFFRSLAEGFERRLIAVLLSEKRGHGTLGLRHVKEHWGVTLAQDSNEIALAANVVDIALPVADMPQRLLAIAQSSGKLGLLRERIATLEAPTSSEVAPQTDFPPAEVASDALNNILALIKEKTGHDFHNYKQPTLLRRIARRLQVHELSDMAGYLGFLNKKPEEIKGLISDLLISVTNFFRDEEAFEALRQDIIPKLFANKTSTDTVRVWSCGCATGEEAYSLAILFSEYTSTLIDAPKFQIFASDISEDAIRTAREGHYDEKSIQDVSPERLERFFTRDGELYSVKKELRDTVLFTVHNVLRDPPFSRLELITCRNLLIYLNRETQEKVLKLFQFALRPGGFLFLGSSESTESASGLFTTLDKPNRLYQSKATTTAYGALSVLPSAGRWEVKIPDLPTRPAQQRVSYGELHYKFLEGFSPPSLLVNEDDTIVHVSESAGQLLHTGGGEPTRQLFQAVKPALKLAVQRALFEAKKGAGIGTSRNVPIKLEGQDTTVTITVRLVKMLEVKMLESGSGFYIVTFALDPKELETEIQATPVVTDSQQDGLVTWLEEELQANREGLRMTIEQYETSAEELRASNEELQAVNEELRAASEELETSKEELQSLNEELMTMIDDQKRTELALKESEQRFQAIFEGAAVGIAQVAPDGTFLSVNDRFCEITSYSRGELLSGGFQTITHPDDLEGDLRRVNQLLTGERDTYALEKRYLRKNGSTVWVNLTVSLVRNPQRAPHYFISAIEDISERKHAEQKLSESNRQLDLLARTSRQLIFNSEADPAVLASIFTEVAGTLGAEMFFYYLVADSRTLQLASSGGLTQAQKDFFATIRFGKFLCGTVAERLEPLVVEHLQNSSFEESEALARAGVTAYAGFPLVAGGKLLGTVAFALQHRERFREGELKLIQSICDQVATMLQRAQTEKALRDSEQALREADKRKDEFLAVLAHELRNPLAPIRTGLEIMKRTSDQEMQQEARDIIERQSQQMVRLIDDLLDVSRISRGTIKLKKERLELEDIVRLAVESAQVLIEDRDHKLSVNLPEKTVWLEGDKTRVCQIVLNLLTNAAKYTNAGGNISLTATLENPHVVISVKDNGIGIPPTMLENVFEMFTRVERETSYQQEGLGIGLNLVKQLVELHGGSVEASSPGENQGSTFTVQLPVLNGRSVQTISDGAPRQTKVFAVRRVLVVDDYEANRKTLSRMLRLMGQEVVAAADGEEALAIIKTFVPEIILLDINMPGMNGYEVAKQIRANPEYPMKLVALTGYGQESDIQTALSAGFDAHLVKPVEIEALEKVLSST